jgi:hypothetical protein
MCVRWISWGRLRARGRPSKSICYQICKIWNPEVIGLQRMCCVGFLSGKFEFPERCSRRTDNHVLIDSISLCHEQDDPLFLVVSWKRIMGDEAKLYFCKSHTTFEQRRVSYFCVVYKLYIRNEGLVSKLKATKMLSWEIKFHSWHKIAMSW